MRRLALVPLGILLALGVLEGGLQIGALALQLSGQHLPATWLSGRRRILCVGDSNTYGLYLADRAQAYPQQLERLWNAGGAPGVEVLNLGYPGTNSSRLRHDMPRMLETFRPDVVILMVGSNDYWTAPVAADAATADLPGRLVQFVERHSRVYQLAYMLSRALDRRQLEVNYPVREHGGSAGVARYGGEEFAMGWSEDRGQRDNEAALKANLRELADIIRAFGAEPVFMTYPSRMWNYGDASRSIRAAAADSTTRLVDLAAVFEPICPTEPCPNWLYEDHHPTAAGYAVIAQTLVRELHGEL